MVDFRKLRASTSKPVVTHPVEIFRRLPHPPSFFDLAASQEEVLDAWYKRRNDRDIVIKLHTGGGKTLMGLLIAQSIMNETEEPVVYLSPTVQLVNQTLAKANEYSIPAVAYEKGEDFQGEFLASKSVLVCTYQALFNGISRFGAPGSRREILKIGGLILDDAHVAFSTVRDSFTLSVQRSENEEVYVTLTNMFREDFKQLGKLGTFDDIVSGADFNILEIPYWNWQARSIQVREYLRVKSDDYKFVWPLLRDSFDYCHALISKDAFVITPLYPLVDLIQTFATCPRRIFMSATIRDDSEIIRTFDASRESIARPIESSSLAGISERMILAPELMQLDNRKVPEIVSKIVDWASEQKIGTVVLVPSEYSARKWLNVATYAESSERVEECVRALQEGKSHGPYVFANRYDGIDLPGGACRLLILDGLPKGASEYELFRNNTFLGGVTLNSNLAQRVEQGMGRAARGPGDYCVVIVTGRDLIRWMGRSSNAKFLTSSTRAQLQMGINVSKNVNDTKGLAAAIRTCFSRNKDWIEYHAETLAESISPEQIDSDALDYAGAERKAFQLWRDGYCEKAIAKLDEHSETAKVLDPQSKGWLLQFAARIAHYWGKNDKAQEFQQHAYAHNRNLLRPKTMPPYVRLVRAGKQAEAIAKEIDIFTPRRGFLSEFDEVAAHLVPEASSNQFEEALKTLGVMLGFSAERPEQTYNNGPDVLWLFNNKTGLVIEAKSRKKQKNAFTKEEHGQLLVATQWFQKEYPGFSCIPVSIQASDRATSKAVAENSRVLTYGKLNELIAEARELFIKLVEMVVSGEELAARCEHLLTSTKLRPKDLIENYLLPFTVDKSA